MFVILDVLIQRDLISSLFTALFLFSPFLVVCLDIYMYKYIAYFYLYHLYRGYQKLTKNINI